MITLEDAYNSKSPRTTTATGATRTTPQAWKGYLIISLPERKNKEEKKMFKDCRTLEELKKKYHELVLKHHPDRGGDLEMMKAVNTAYDKFFPLLKNKHINKAGKMYEKQSNETPEYFKDIIERLMKFEGTYIEIIGSFIWVTGDTKPYKDSLKKMGFKWHVKKLCWYLPPEGYRKFGKKEYSLDDIRNMYGSKGFQAHGSMKLETEAV